VIGGLPGALFTRELGYKRIFLPTDNILEAAIIPGVDIVAVSTLRDIVDMLTGAKDIVPVPLQDPLSLSLRTQHPVDMGTILGQEHAKRALMIAAAGGHNILLQ
jgi:magnesium chelatase family protein